MATLAQPANGHAEDAEVAPDTSRVIEISLPEELVEVSLDELEEDPESLSTLENLLGMSSAGASNAIRIAEEFWRRGSRQVAIDILDRRIERLRLKPHDYAADLVQIRCLLASFFLAQSRKAPKKILTDARQDRQPPGTRTKDFYWQQATRYVNEAENGVSQYEQLHSVAIRDARERVRTTKQAEAEAARTSYQSDMLDTRKQAAADAQEILSALEKKVHDLKGLTLDAKAALALAMGKIDDASRIFELILSRKPTHLIALHGRARIQVSRRQFKPALATYTYILRLSPNVLPDPRIGIGICLWHLGDQLAARRAWERSATVSSERASIPVLLLGLSWINASRDPELSEEERAEMYGVGLTKIQESFKAESTNASAASALAGYFVTTKNFATATKLAERSIQHADTRAVLAEAYLALARVFHAQGQLEDATKQYSLAVELAPEQLTAVIAVGQMLIVKNDFPAAMNHFENVIRRQPRNIEALANLAAIRFHQAITSAPAESGPERAKAREHYDAIIRLFPKNSPLVSVSSTEPFDADSIPAAMREVVRDPDLYVEHARLWSDDDVPKALRSLKESARVLQSVGKPVSSQLYNNIGAMEYSLGNVQTAREAFEAGLTAMVSPDGTIQTSKSEDDASFSMLTFNLGVAYESEEKVEQAIDMYGKILDRHAEYVDAKARLALIYLKQKQVDKAHELLKQALTSAPASLELRSLYTHFLSETNQLRFARDFAIGTLKDHNRHDIYALCASGNLHYMQARENKGVDGAAQRDRATKYLRAIEFYEKALQLDPKCTAAAQGTAIWLAEGSLALGSTDSATRLKHARDALTILAKVRESLPTGGVYVNMGHCHAARDEWDRAIEFYETASKRFYGERNVQALLYLARAWYQRATKDQSFSALRSALEAAEKAAELSPADETIKFNIALIKQREMEVLFELPPSRRTMAELRLAIEDGNESTTLFAALAQATGSNKPYNTDVAHQRRRFGETLSKRAAEKLDEQQQYEDEELEKQAKVRRQREDDEKRRKDEQDRRMVEIQERAARIAAERERLKEAAASMRMREDEIQEEVTRVKKKRKSRKAGKEGEEEPAASGGDSSDSDVEKPKKKAPRRKKKVKTADESGEGTGSDDAAPAAAPNRSRKAFKSAEFIDSDDDA